VLVMYFGSQERCVVTAEALRQNPKARNLKLQDLDERRLQNRSGVEERPVLRGRRSI